MRRVLVTGSRDWSDWSTLCKVLNEQLLIDNNLVIVHGACQTGADKMAHSWVAVALSSVYPVTEEPHPADWSQHGKAAGLIRNKEMVDAGADVCLAFILNGSRGASHCARLAEQAGIQTIRITR